MECAPSPSHDPPIVIFGFFRVFTYRRYVSEVRSETAPTSLEGASRLLNDGGACSGDKDSDIVVFKKLSVEGGNHLCLVFNG